MALFGREAAGWTMSVVRGRADLKPPMWLMAPRAGALFIGLVALLAH